jgi:hypothetical protein
MAPVIITIFLVLIIAEFIAYLIYRSGSFKDIRKFYDRLLGRDSAVRNVETFTPRYSEHPFLAFSLNPEFRNPFGEKIHNKYGFRCKEEFEDLNDKDLVYCIGGSSTYCAFIEKNEDTWPDILNGELTRASHNEKLKVINGACGGWTSYQSLIRFLAWIDVLKPKLVIVYHGKNDFAPFVNGKLSEKEIYPDYGNVMRSLRLDGITKRFSVLSRASYICRVLYGAYVSRKYLYVLLHIYGSSRKLTREEAKQGLKRVGPKEYEFIMSRYRTFAALCKDRKIPILFVTQKVETQQYKPYMEELNRGIKALECREKGCFVYDFDKEVPNKEGLLYDHIHFTPFGGRIFAKYVKDFIIKNVPSFKGQRNEA